MAAPTPVASAEALVSAIQKSGLLQSAALARVRELAAKSPDPKALARELVKDGTLTRWQAEQLLHGYYRLIIGKYKLLDQLGTAPTGRLYLAEHAQMGRRHTIKVLAKRLAANPQAVQQFIAAAKRACSLDHRNISHVYDVIQDHERQNHYIVMEYVEGEDLDKLVQRVGPLEPLDAIDFLIQATEGLAHAHESGVVHGDLKPSNLLLDQTGAIKILEIGQAGTGALPQTDPVDESIEMAALGAVIFQPPELRGDGQAAHISTDMYSLGSILAFLLTGEASPDAATATARLKEHPEIPPELIELCGRMMVDKPEERPPAMGRVLEQLAPIVRQLVAAAKKQKAEPGDSALGPKSDQATSDAGNSKKHPVAKSLDAAAVPVEIVIPGVTHEVIADVAPPEAPVIKTRGRIGKAPAAKPAVAEASSAKTATTRFTPLVMASVIGGGIMLVLALVITVAGIWLVGRKAKPAAAQAPAAAGPALGGAQEPESNPQPLVEETNPAVSLTPAIEQPPQPAASNSAPEPDMPAAATSPPAPKESEQAAVTTPPVTPEPTAAEPALAKKADEEPKASEPLKAEAKPAQNAEKKPAAKPAAKPAPKPPAKVEPFRGLAKAASLPALVDAGGQPLGQRPAPAELGPCKPGEEAAMTATLIGGDNAVRGTRHKFDVQPKADQARAWDFVLNGVGQPSTIATLTVGAGKLLFEWTDEALKQAPIAKQLANCTLVLTTGENRHELGLRAPIIGSPLTVDIEKPGSTRFSIGDLPVAKQLLLEVTRVEGFKDIQVEPKQGTIGEEIVVWFGEEPKSLPLAVKLDTSSTARDIEIKQQAYLKLEDQEPRLYRRKELLNQHAALMQQVEFITPELTRTKNSRPTRDVEKLLKEQKIDALAKQQLMLGKRIEQINFATGFSEKYPRVLVHFRVYYQSGETQLELFRTEQATEKGK